MFKKRIDELINTILAFILTGIIGLCANFFLSQKPAIEAKINNNEDQIKSIKKSIDKIQSKIDSEFRYLRQGQEKIYMILLRGKNE